MQFNFSVAVICLQSRSSTPVVIVLCPTFGLGLSLETYVKFEVEVKVFHFEVKGKVRP